MAKREVRLRAYFFYICINRINLEQSIQLFGTGLDLDSNLATIAPGDSPFRLNLRIGSTQNRNGGGGENFPSTTLKTTAYGGGNFVQPNGQNITIGNCKDTERNAIIYFVYNSLGNHQIRRYFASTGEIQLILQHPRLNFHRENKIMHAAVVGDVLTWTDGWINPVDEFDYNPPMQIDINKAIGYTLGLPWPQGYSSMDLQTLSAIRYAPGLCPTFNFVNDTAFQDNRLYGHLFQFGYRWVYYDNSRSVISPLSKLTQPQGEDIEGNYDLQVENRLDVSVKTGHQTVVRIELVVRENTVYKVVDYVDKYDSNGGILIPSNSDYVFRFFNDKYISTIPNEEALRPFDFLPQVAKCMDVMRSNTGARRVYAQIMEGYANVPDFDMSVDVNIEKIDPADVNYKRISFKRKGAYQLGLVYSDAAGRKSFVQANEQTKTTIPWWRDSQIIQTYYNPADEWIISSHQKPYIEWQINSAPPTWATTYQIVCTNDYQNQQRLYGFYAWGACVGDNEKGLFQKGKNTLYVPPQVGYEFQEGDRIRIVEMFSTLRNQNVTKDVNALDNDTGGGGLIPTQWCNKLGAVVDELNTATPAFPYQVNLWQTYNDVTGTKWDFPITEFNKLPQRIKFNGDFNLDHRTLYRFEIYSPLTQIDETNERFYEIGETYEILNGEHSVTSGRIDGVDIFVKNELYKFTPIEFRLWASNASKISVNDFVDRFQVPSMALRGETPLRHAFDTGLWQFKGSFTDFGSSASADYSKVRIQDASQNGQVYDSNVGGVYGLDGGSFNVTECENQVTYSNVNLAFGSAIFTNYNISGQQVVNDHYMGPETGMIGNSPCVEFEIKNLIVESHVYSQYYQSDVNQNGRPYVINREAVRKEYTNIRYGGALTDNSLLNFFSLYRAEDLIPLSESYNRITRIQVSGVTLKVRQLSKSTSIYIDRTETMNTDGSSNLIASDKVLGTVNQSMEYYGGTNGAADTMSIRDTYFFDAINGAVVRDAANGLVTISGNKDSINDPYKMTAFFRALGNFVKDNPDSLEVFALYDENIECYVLCIKDLRRESKAPDFMKEFKVSEAWNGGLTLAFNEPSNRWITFLSYTPEWFASIGNTFLSFVDGNAHLHYGSETRNRFYGNLYPSVSSQICNMYTNNIKSFDNIDVYSNQKWHAEGSPDGEDIFILPNAQFPEGMRSKLSEALFVGKEGKWNASFRCDMNTPGFSNEMLAFINGRRLRGDAMKITLRNNMDTPVFLRGAIVHFTQSGLSG